MIPPGKVGMMQNKAPAAHSDFRLMKLANRPSVLAASQGASRPTDLDIDELKRELRGVRFAMKETRALCERAAAAIDMMQAENAALVHDLGAFHLTANTETTVSDMRGARIKQLESVLDQIARLGTNATNAELSAIAAAVLRGE
jgi:hypothetical protein